MRKFLGCGTDGIGGVADDRRPAGRFQRWVNEPSPGLPLVHVEDDLYQDSSLRVNDSGDVRNPAASAKAAQGRGIRSGLVKRGNEGHGRGKGRKQSDLDRAAPAVDARTYHAGSEDDPG